MANGSVTIRDRDTLLQERVAADRVATIIRERIAQ
jgi:glycyl-tRNA synthetase (class II)